MIELPILSAIALLVATFFIGTAVGIRLAARRVMRAMNEALTQRQGRP